MMADSRALRGAAGDEDVKAILALVKAEPELIEDWKPLLDSCYNGRARSVEALLKAGADPNALSKTAHRYRPLHRVVERKSTRPTHEGHDACVKALLEQGADPKARGGFDRVTPLQMAAIGNETRFIPPLKKAFGTLDIFHACVLADDKAVIRLLKKQPDLAKASDENGWPPMMYVAASLLHRSDRKVSAKLVAIAEQLIGLGAAPNPSILWGGKWPLTGLYRATGYGGHAALARVMLEHGADPNDGESLHHSAENLYVDCLELLLEYGGDLNKPDNDDYSTPLYFVLQYGKLKGIPWLLEHGADPNVKNGELGRTSLHAAAARGCNDEVLQMLIDAGVDVKAKDKEGSTAFDIAKDKKKKRVVAFLEK
jgi:ankyrin repeat protein